MKFRMPLPLQDEQAQGFFPVCLAVGLVILPADAVDTVVGALRRLRSCLFIQVVRARLPLQGLWWAAGCLVQFGHLPQILNENGHSF